MEARAGCGPRACVGLRRESLNADCRSEAHWVEGCWAAGLGARTCSETPPPLAAPPPPRFGAISFRRARYTLWPAEGGRPWWWAVRGSANGLGARGGGGCADIAGVPPTRGGSARPRGRQEHGVTVFGAPRALACALGSERRVRPLPRAQPAAPPAPAGPTRSDLCALSAFSVPTSHTARPPQPTWSVGTLRLAARRHAMPFIPSDGGLKGSHGEPFAPIPSH